MKELSILGLVWDTFNKAHIWERHQLRDDKHFVAAQQHHRLKRRTRGSRGTCNTRSPGNRKARIGPRNQPGMRGNSAGPWDEEAKITSRLGITATAPEPEPPRFLG